MGQVLQAGAGQIPARQAAVNGGISMNVPALTINKVCLSGVNAIALADQLIRAGECEVVVAGGMESMTNAPHLLEKSREGFKYGDVTMRDHIGPRWPVERVHRPGDGCADRGAQRVDRGFRQGSSKTSSPRSRTSALRPGGRTASSQTKSYPSRFPERRGDPVVVAEDEGIRADTTAESLSRLRPAFSKDGTITAGSASQISRRRVRCHRDEQVQGRGARAGLACRDQAHGQVAGPDSTRQSQPAHAIKAACDKAGISPADLDLVEINEAFAAVGIASTRELAISGDLVNVNGGAIALGHPIGMSGARIVLHLALELARRGGGVGAAALCGGGGQR